MFKWGWITTPWQERLNSYPQKNISGFTTKRCSPHSPLPEPDTSSGTELEPWAVNHHEYKVLSLKDKFMVFKICSVVQFADGHEALWCRRPAPAAGAQFPCWW